MNPFPSSPNSAWKAQLRQSLKQFSERQDWLEYHLHELAELNEELRAEAALIRLILDFLEEEDSPE